jgi:serine/threonine protein phosphatase 1
VELPIVLDVETETGLVGLVHGDVPRGLGWEEFKRRLSVPSVLEYALHGRDRVLNRSQDLVPGVERVYVGHTRVMRPLVLGNFCAIDTGVSYAGGDLSGYSAGALTLLDASVPLDEIASRSFSNAVAEDVFAAA